MFYTWCYYGFGYSSLNFGSLPPWDRRRLRMGDVMLSESPDPALLICLDFNVDIGVVSAFFCADIRLICGLLTDAADCFRL